MYSLGVLLYELLTGETPLDRQLLRESQIMETLRMIREDEPPKPSTRVSSLGEKAATLAAYRKSKPETLATEIRGDLDWIVMKALAKERSRRYDSAARFGEDIQRFLKDEVVDVRPPSIWYRTQKWYRRNRTFAWVSTILCLAIVVAVGGLLYGYYQSSIAIAKLQTEVFNKVLLKLMDERSLRDEEWRFAEEHLPEPKLEVLRGVRAFYGDKLIEAIEHLDRGEETAASVAVKAYAAVMHGDSEAFFESIDRLKSDDLKPVTAQDHLMLAQLYHFAAPLKARYHIEQAQSLQDVGILGQVIESFARANIAIYQDELAEAEQWIKKLEAAAELRPDQDFLKDHLLFLYQLARHLALRQNKSGHAKDYFDRAKTLSSLLINRPKSSPWLAGFLADDPQQDFNAALKLYENDFQESTNYRVMDYVAVALLASDPKRAEEFLKERPEEFNAKLGLALLLAADPARAEEAREFAMQVITATNHCDDRVRAMRALFMTGMPLSEVNETASKLLPHTRDLVLPYRRNLRFWAGESDAFASQTNPSIFDTGESLDRGMVLMRTAPDEAKKHFEACVRAGRMGTPYWWGKYLLSKMGNEK